MSSGWRRVRDTVHLIIQFRLNGAFGDDEDDRRYDRLVGILEALFDHSGLGKEDGTDSGGGKLNVYIYSIRDADWEKAVELVLKELDREGLLHQAIVAQSISWESDDDERIDYTVVLPRDWQGEFSIM